MNDYMVWCSVRTLFESSKNKTWREAVCEKTTVVYGFLLDKKLMVANPLTPEGKVDIDFVLMRSHLTDIGYKMFETIIPNWQNARDRDGNFKNISILENGLKKLQANK